VISLPPSLRAVEFVELQDKQLAYGSLLLGGTSRNSPSPWLAQLDLIYWLLLAERQLGAASVGGVAEAAEVENRKEAPGGEVSEKWRRGEAVRVRPPPRPARTGGLRAASGRLGRKNRGFNCRPTGGRVYTPTDREPKKEIPGRGTFA
jgi:hypothetical protein